jgi:hypothetical protein
VTDEPIETVGGPLELIVGDDVEVDVDVDVLVGELVVDVLEGELVADDEEGFDVEVLVDVGVPGCASLGGRVVVPDAIGVLEGRVGRLTEREVLGRFEPPPHAAINTREIAQSAIARDRMRCFRVAALITAHDSRRVAGGSERVVPLAGRGGIVGVQDYP